MRRHRPRLLRQPRLRRQAAASRPTNCGPSCSRACLNPCSWSARTATPTCASSPSVPRPSRCGGSSPTSASPPIRRGLARRADRTPGTTRPSRSYPTGTPWRNHHLSMSSTRKCSGSRLPSSPPASDAPLPAPRHRQTTPHAHSAPSETRPAPSEMATSSPYLPIGSRVAQRSACHAPPSDGNVSATLAARAVGFPIPPLMTASSSQPPKEFS